MDKIKMAISEKSRLTNKKIFDVTNINREKMQDIKYIHEGHEINQTTTFRLTSQREMYKVDEVHGN